MSQGKILAQGTLSDLTHKGIDFVKLLTTEEIQNDEESNEDSAKKKERKQSTKATEEDTKTNEKQNGQAEKMAEGAISAGIYYSYFKTGNSSWGLFFLFSACILAQVSI